MRHVYSQMESTSDTITIIMYASHERLRNNGSPNKAEERWSVNDEHSVASLHVVILDDRSGFLRNRDATKNTDRTS